MALMWVVTGETVKTTLWMGIASIKGDVLWPSLSFFFFFFFFVQEESNNCYAKSVKFIFGKCINPSLPPQNY